MKRSRMVIGLAAAVFLAWCGSLPAAEPAPSQATTPPAHAVAAPAPAGGPSARIPEPAFHFDPVIEGVEVTHDFVVRNEGDAPLQIDRVATG